MDRTIVFVVAGILLAGCATTAGGGTEAPNCAWRACLRFSDGRSGRTYLIENNEPVPVTVRLTFRTLTNLRPQSEIPVERIIAARSTATVIRLSRVQADRSIGAEPSLAVDLGSDSTVADEGYPYSVPFGGDSARTLNQGFDGPDTHLGGMRYSLDFGMPEGTPVIAARAGVVVHIQDGFTEGGLDPALLDRANVVVVAHSDGTMASYGHLSPGIVVSKGDAVEAGDLLGASGSSGFAGQPHLHFHVGKRLLGDPGRTIPITIVDRNGQVLDLEPGSHVEPGPSKGARGS